MYIILYHPKHIYLTNNPRVLKYVCYRGSIFMLYNPLLETISTYVTGRTTRLSTPSLHTPRFATHTKNPHSHTPFAPSQPRSRSPATTQSPSTFSKPSWDRHTGSLLILALGGKVLECLIHCQCTSETFLHAPLQFSRNS